MILTSLLSTITVAAGVVAADAPRQQLDLNGTWQFQRTDNLEKPPQPENWKTCEVPGYLRGTDYERAWFRRTFIVPESMRGCRIKIRFGGVKYNSRVLLNGKHAGGCFGGYRPFEVDVTDAVRFGEENELLVGVHDWTGLFTPGRVDLSDHPDWSRMRSRPKDKILSPIGGIFESYGIWDDVTLVAHPAIYVKDLFIKPSVRQGELVVDYVLENESDEDVEVHITAAVEDAGQDVLSLPGQSVRLPAGQTVAVTLRQAWPDPRHWSHVDPHLYHLRTELSSGDVLRTRFGFREFWVDGHRFYLNGKRVNLLATSWWSPRTPMPRQEIRERWETVKQMGCVAFRTHTQPWRSVHYDVADEVGLLMINEGAVWNDESVYRINDPVFWENYAAHLKAMVDRDKNRPSMIMWSLENEFYGGRLNDEAPAKADLVRMGELVRKWDPTRPFFYESDGDPGGVADVIGIHYPHEYPDYTCWPNEADWLAEPQESAGHHFTNGETEFFWRKNKPLYIGEFLWLPSADPSWHTVFFGDDAYLDYRRYRNMGKAESWRMQILGYRHHEVAGISPWTVIEGGPLDDENYLCQAHQFAYQKIAAYCHDYDSRFFSGETVARRLEVFNDLFDRSNLTVAWTLSAADEVVDQGDETLELEAGDHRMLTVDLHMPQAMRRTPLAWKITIRRDDTQVFEHTYEYAVFPPVKSKATAARIGLYDPKETSAAAFERLGVALRPIASLTSELPELGVLIIGAGALDREQQPALAIGEVPPERQALMDFVGCGGRILVLRQDAYPEGRFDVSLAEHQSTMTFPLCADHPILLGIEPGDLKFWRGDHMVSSREIVRPTKGGCTPIVVSGSKQGIHHSPLLERRIGGGAIIHSQLRLVEKSGKEPTADRLLVNILQYLSNDFDGAKVARHKTAVIGGSDEYHRFLRSVGLRYDDLTNRLADTDLSTYKLILCRDDLSHVETLKSFVEQGGNLLVHRPGRDAVEAVCDAFGSDLELQPYSGPVTRAEGEFPLLNRIAREDLYWLGEHVGISWSPTPRATEMADGMFGKRIDNKSSRQFEVEQWELEGYIVERREPGVTFATIGSASAEVDFLDAGTYVFGIVGRGTPCDGGWPMARVSIDDVPLGQTTIPSDGWQTSTVFGHVEKGRHRVSVAFINDQSNSEKHEDRNLYVDKVLVAFDPNPDASFLTSPPVTARIRRGQGQVVIDQLRWDTEQRNGRKATRYVSSLLTALGGDFTPRFCVTVECETLKPPPGMQHFRVAGGIVSQATNGTIRGPIHVAVAGRYTMELTARGTQLDGIYPLVEIHLDGQEQQQQQERLGQVQIASDHWRSYPLSVQLPEGTHELSLSFVNDANRPGEADRNVMYDRMVFYRD